MIYWSRFVFIVSFFYAQYIKKKLSLFFSQSRNPGGMLIHLATLFNLTDIIFERCVRLTFKIKYHFHLIYLTICERMSYSLSKLKNNFRWKKRNRNS